MRPLGGGVEAAADTPIGQEGRLIEYTEAHLSQCYVRDAFTLFRDMIIITQLYGFTFFN